MVLYKYDAIILCLTHIYFSQLTMSPVVSASIASHNTVCNLSTSLYLLYNGAGAILIMGSRRSTYDKRRVTEHNHKRTLLIHMEYNKHACALESIIHFNNNYTCTYY